MMKNLKAETENQGQSEVPENGDARIGNESQKFPSETQKNKVSSGKGRRVLRMDRASIEQGIIWHEVLSEPMYKRRRKR